MEHDEQHEYAVFFNPKKKKKKEMEVRVSGICSNGQGLFAI